MEERDLSESEKTRLAALVAQVLSPPAKGVDA